MRTVKQVITLAELPGKGWLWRERGTQRRSLAVLLSAVKSEARHMAKEPGVAVIQSITYEPSTPLGTAVAKAVSAA